MYGLGGGWEAGRCGDVEAPWWAAGRCGGRCVCVLTFVNATFKAAASIVLLCIGVGFSVRQLTDARVRLLMQDSRDLCWHRVVHRRHQDELQVSVQVGLGSVVVCAVFLWYHMRHRNRE